MSVKSHENWPFFRKLFLKRRLYYISNNLVLSSINLPRLECGYQCGRFS